MDAQPFVYDEEVNFGGLDHDNNHGVFGLAAPGGAPPMQVVASADFTDIGAAHARTAL